MKGGPLSLDPRWGYGVHTMVLDAANDSSPLQLDSSTLVLQHDVSKAWTYSLTSI